MSVQSGLRLFAKHYRQCVAGGIAASFAILLPILIGGTGLALDVGESTHVRQRLCSALDASVLAGASSSMDDDEIEDTINEYFDENYPDDAIGVSSDLDVDVGDNEVTASVTADYETRFMRILGRETITIGCSTTVQRNVKGLEVVMVLDNTGSMGGSNIASLKTSATNLVNILFDTVTDPEDVRIGLVPYSVSVNVGPYGLGLNPDGSAYGTSFVNNPSGKTYDATPDSESDWAGCVLANDYDDDVTDNDGPWDMMDAGNEYTYTQQTNCEWVRRRGRWVQQCDEEEVTGFDAYTCSQPVTPITSDQAALTTAINAMSAEGYTFGNYGMVWGYRLISPDAPFEEAAEYDDPEWNKAIIMMTDGDNNIGGNNTYSTYGWGRDHDMDNGDLNERFEDVCENAKADGIIIYTITFTSGISESTKDYYRECATDLNHYYDAPTQAELENVFEDIAYALAKLHIKN